MNKVCWINEINMTKDQYREEKQIMWTGFLHIRDVDGTKDMNLVLYTFDSCHYLTVACIIASTSYMSLGWRCKNVTHYRT